MNVLTRLETLVEQLRGTNSTNNKKDIIKSIAGDTELIRLLKETYDPFKQFNLTSDMLKKHADKMGENIAADIFELLDMLSSRVATGHAAIELTNSFVKQFGHAKIIYDIIDKDLKCKVTDTIINEVLPGTIPSFDVALANNYEKLSPKLKPDYTKDWFWSRKLDGVRCIAMIDAAGAVSLWSRQGKEFTTLDKVKQAIQELGLVNTVLDGEVCLINENGKENFQDVMKEIRKKDHTINNPRYLIFDILTMKGFLDKFEETPFFTRQSNLLTLFNSQKFSTNILQIVDQEIVHDAEHFATIVANAAANGWEGVMLRKGFSPYSGKRSNDLLKVKQMLDAEYKVVNVTMGTIDDGSGNKVEGLSSVTIIHKNNKVDVGSGFKFAERIFFRDNPKEILDKIITVQYFEETEDKLGNKSLRFPVFKVLHGNKRTV